MVHNGSSWFILVNNGLFWLIMVNVGLIMVYCDYLDRLMFMAYLTMAHYVNSG